MSNYVVSGRPFNGERNLSEVMRDEFKLIQDSIATKGESGGVSGTSTTSVTIGTGTKTFTMQTGKEIVVGMNMFAADTVNPANNMQGVVTEYNSSTGLIRISVSTVNGSGTKSSWSIGLANPVGVTLSSNTFTGSQNFARSTVASAATTADIWAGSNQIDFTGTDTVTAFPAAPQGGSWRELICADACSFTASSDLKISGVTTGATYTAQANDIVMVRALTTTAFLLTIQRYDGKPSLTGASKKLYIRASNGSGSTNTRIGRYSTVVTNTGEGTDWNYVDSATLGGSITILRSGWYSINVLDFSTAGGYAGISIDATQLTTNFSSLTNDSERLVWTGEHDGGAETASFFGYITSGSVLRLHHDGTLNNSTNARLTIERIL